MLLWQQNNQKLRKQSAVIAQLLGVLLGLHLLMLLLFFGISRKQKPLRLSLHKTDRLPVVFFTTYQQAAPHKQTVTKTVAKKTAVKKAVTRKQAVTKKTTPAVAQKAAPKKKQHAIVKPQQKTTATLPVQKKESQPHVAESVDKPVAQQSLQEQIPVLTKQERETIILETVLAQQIAPYFKTPVGVSPALECRVLVSIDSRGKLYTYTIEQSSGCFLYDMAVEQALAHVEQFPPWAAGQQYSILFN